MLVLIPGFDSLTAAPPAEWPCRAVSMAGRVKIDAITDRRHRNCRVVEAPTMSDADAVAFVMATGVQWAAGAVADSIR